MATKPLSFSLPKIGISQAQFREWVSIRAHELHEERRSWREERDLEVARTALFAVDDSYHCWRPGDENQVAMVLAQARQGLSAMKDWVDAESELKRVFEPG